MDTLAEIVDRANSIEDPSLMRDLLAREDAIRDSLQFAAMQYGLFPQIVAEVIAELGIGTPPPPEVRAHIRAQYEGLMAEIRRAQEG